MERLCKRGLLREGDVYKRQGHPQGKELDYFDSKEFYEKLENMFAYAESKGGEFYYENCCNGGTLKSFDILKRMTFMTTVDDSADGFSFRRALYANGYMKMCIRYSFKRDLWIITFLDFIVKTVNS